MYKLTLNDYEITKDGEVFNKTYNRKIKYELNDKGYYRVIIGGERYFIHKLVAQKFNVSPSTIRDILTYRSWKKVRVE